MSLQRIWQYIQPPSQPQTSNHGGPGLHNQNISAQTVINLIRVLVGALTLLQFVVITGKCSSSMAAGSLEGCSLHGWILLDTVPGTWQTACVASCGRVVCWCQRECPMVAVGLRWADITNTCILSTDDIYAEILWQHLNAIVVPFICRHRVVLQDDGARPHAATICTQFLEKSQYRFIISPSL